jgi:hypothetical protein
MRALVTVQDANGVGVIDLVNNEVLEVIGLGAKDFSLDDSGFSSNNFIDTNDKDGATILRPVKVRGRYPPDAIACGIYDAGRRDELSFHQNATHRRQVTRGGDQGSRSSHWAAVTRSVRNRAC